MIFLNIVVFITIALYFYSESKLIVTYGSSFMALFFMILASFRANALRPLNKIWMQFGLLLGLIVSPIILGIIFFGLITPTAILMRIKGRDALRLRSEIKTSFWIKRQSEKELGSFKNQF